MHASVVPSATTAATIGAKHPIASRTRARQQLTWAVLVSLMLHGLLLRMGGVPVTTTPAGMAAHTIQVVLNPVQREIERVPALPDISRQRDRRPAQLPEHHSQNMEMPIAVLPTLRSEYPLGAPTFAAGNESTVDIETTRETARAIARDAVRASAREMTAITSAFAIPRPEPDAEPTPMARAIVRSTNANCREKYAGAGLLGLPFLIKDQFSDSGCIW